VGRHGSRCPARGTARSSTLIRNCTICFGLSVSRISDVDGGLLNKVGRRLENRYIGGAVGSGSGLV
jgi:hypothetical protein